MTTGASWLARGRARATSAITAACCALFAATATAPTTVHATATRGARAHGRVGSLAGRLISRRDGPLTVALGATRGDERARTLLARALSDAVAQNPALRLQPDVTRGASIVLTANVRALSVQHDPAGALARCDVGIVVADANGAVRAMLDARRVVRGDAVEGSAAADDALVRAALRSAMDGALRRLVESGQWVAPAVM